jgi:hypothetical protein
LAKVGRFTDKMPGRGDLGASFRWPRAERYVIATGWIRPEGPRRKEDREYIGRSRNYDRHPGPLHDGDLLYSFARLGSQGRPKEDRIRSWVMKYGLLIRRDSQRDGDTDLDDGRVNQADMMVEEFLREVYYARDLLRLYSDVRTRNVDSIKHKARNPRTEVERVLADDTRVRLLANPRPRSNDRDPVVAAMKAASNVMPRLKAKIALSMQAAGTRAPDMFVWHAEQVLCRLLSQKLDDIRLCVVSGFQLPPDLTFGRSAAEVLASEEFAKAKKPPARYRPALSWICQDLRSAIYLQLLLDITNDRPMRVCADEDCGAHFSPDRIDNIYCTRACKEHAKDRRKAVKHRGSTS